MPQNQTVFLIDRIFIFARGPTNCNSTLISGTFSFPDFFRFLGDGVDDAFSSVAVNFLYVSSSNVLDTDVMFSKRGSCAS